MAVTPEFYPISTDDRLRRLLAWRETGNVQVGTSAGSMPAVSSSFCDQMGFLMAKAAHRRSHLPTWLSFIAALLVLSAAWMTMATAADAAADPGASLRAVESVTPQVGPAPTTPNDPVSPVGPLGRDHRECHRSAAPGCGRWLTPELRPRNISGRWRIDDRRGK